MGPHFFYGLCVYIWVDGIHKVLSVIDSVMEVHPIVEISHIVIGCPTITVKGTEWL